MRERSREAGIGMGFTSRNKLESNMNFSMY